MDAKALSPPEGLVGPNAVIQLAAALRDLMGPGAGERVFAQTGYPALFEQPPDEMTDQAIASALLNGVWDTLPPDQAAIVAAEAGRRTADYVIANRIPRPAKVLLRWLPRPISARMLLKAIQRNAWTFAGSGICETETSPRYLISIRENPLAMPDCVWHRAVFERLFRRLVSARTRVRHPSCCRNGDASCRFELDLS